MTSPPSKKPNVDKPKIDLVPLSPRQTWIGHQLFSKDENQNRICILCPSTSNSISNKSSQNALKHHLNSKHYGWETIVASNSKQRLLAPLSVGSRCLSSTDKAKRMPLALVESKSLRKLLRFYCDEAVMMSRRTAQRKLVKSYRKMKLKILTYIRQHSTSVSLTVDCWTSRSQQSFLGITVHELVIYGSEPVVAWETDPLGWWKINSSRFPCLAKAARDYLSIQATSMPSESLFSVAGDIARSRRSRLSPLNMRVLVSLKSWIGNGWQLELD
ncbi:hypothetical protein P9112_009558 [Eukaryota sp. TZLM1-RC]